MGIGDKFDELKDKAKDALGGDMAPTFLFDTSATVQIIEALGDTNDPSVAQLRDGLGRFGDDLGGCLHLGRGLDGDDRRLHGAGDPPDRRPRRQR